MSDYTKTVNFAAKDALASGNAAKAAKGTEVDTELNNIATAIATKYDSNDRNTANGIAPLDASSLLPAANLPTATETAIGALEIATSAEATALTAADKILVPSVISDSISAWGDLNAGAVTDIQALTDPGADRFLCWDDSAGEVTWFTLGDGLGTAGTTTISVDILGIEDLTDPGLDSLMFWDNSAGFVRFGAPTKGVEINGTQLQMADVVAAAGQPVVVTDGTFTFDLSAMDTISVSGLDVSQDGVVVSDNGTIKVMPVDEAGIQVVEVTADQTFALTDATTFQLLTGTTDRTWDIPLNASVAFVTGTIIYVGSRDTATLTISPNTSGVRLTSVNGSDVGPSAGDVTVLPGGTAALIYVGGDEWMATGDLG